MHSAFGFDARAARAKNELVRVMDENDVPRTRGM